MRSPYTYQTHAIHIACTPQAHYMHIPYISNIMFLSQLQSYSISFPFMHIPYMFDQISEFVGPDKPNGSRHHTNSNGRDWAAVIPGLKNGTISRITSCPL